MSAHPGIEALSAYVDGELSDHASHVAECPDCQAEVGALEAVRAAVSVAPTAGGEARKDRAIARAMAAQEAEPAPEAGNGHNDLAVPSRAWRRWRPLAAVASAAAVVLGALLAVAVVDDDRKSNVATDTASRPLDENTDQQRSPEAPTVAEAGDIGEVADVAALLERVSRPENFAGPGSGPQTAAPEGGAGTAGGTAAPAMDAAPSQSPAIPSPREVGTRPCEVPVRLLHPTLGPVLYYATARWQEIPAVVLGFAPQPEVTRPLTLFVMSQDGCRPLAQATTP